MPTLSRLGVLGALLVALGGGLVAASAVDRGDPAMRAADDERPVNVRAGDLGDISAHNSPTIARNPRDADSLAVAGRIDTPDFSCSLHVSSDGGRRWRRTAVPTPGERTGKCYAPDVAFAADGTLHLSYVTLRGAGNVPHAVWHATSADGGRTLRAPTRVAGPRAFQVRLTVDPRRPRRVHLTWVQAREVGPLRFTRPDNPILATRSDDGGRRWRRPERVNASSRRRVLAPSPQVGPDGRLYVLFLDVGDDRLDYHGGHDGYGGPPYAGRFTLVLGRSAGAGRGWEESVVDERVAPAERFVPFLPPFPSLAVDRRDGRIFAALHDRRAGSADAWLWTLERDAGTWRGPTRINDTPPTDRSSQTLPRIAVAPDGRLDAVYLDRRADARDVLAEVSLQSSFDGGRSFGPRVTLSSRAFDTRIGFGSEREMPDLGSRIGLVSGDDRAVAVWPDTRHGTEASNKQDLMAASAVLDRSGGGAVREAGLALIAGGVMALLLAGLRRRTLAR